MGVSFSDVLGSAIPAADVLCLDILAAQILPWMLGMDCSGREVRGPESTLRLTTTLVTVAIFLKYDN